jgi:hypothetical protein
MGASWILVRILTTEIIYSVTVFIKKFSKKGKDTKNAGTFEAKKKKNIYPFGLA